MREFAVYKADQEAALVDAQCDDVGDLAGPVVVDDDVPLLVLGLGDRPVLDRLLEFLFFLGLDSDIRGGPVERYQLFGVERRPVPRWLDQQVTVDGAVPVENEQQAVLVEPFAQWLLGPWHRGGRR